MTSKWDAINNVLLSQLQQHTYKGKHDKYSIHKCDGTVVNEHPYDPRTEVEDIPRRWFPPLAPLSFAMAWREYGRLCDVRL